MEKILKSEWKPLLYIKEGWDILTNEEKKEVTDRVEILFQKDFIKMKTSPVFYLHVFSFLAQVEVLAIQVPLKFMEKFDETTNNKLRRQLVDEVVHGLIFSKMAHHLSLPFTIPIPIIDSVEKMCDGIRCIEDEKLAIIALNLIAEGWIEEIFECLQNWGFADQVFKSILSDEERHVSEATMYTKLGVNEINRNLLETTVREMESNLLEAITANTVFRSLVEINNIREYNIMSKKLFDKHKIQLKKLNIEPSKKWTSFEKQIDNFFKVDKESFSEEIEKTFETTIFSKVWNSPCDPTMRTRIDLDLPDYFETKSLNLVLVYFCGKFLEDQNYNFSLRYVNNHKVMKVKTSNLGIRILIDTKNGKEIGTINIHDVQKLSLNELKNKIVEGRETLKFWKNKRLEFMKHYEFQEKDYYKSREDFSFSLTKLPTLSTDVPFTISNVGSLGFDSGYSALSGMNTGDMCIGKEFVKPKWSVKEEKFLPQKCVPLVFSIDHRIVSPHNFNIKRFKQMFSDIDWEGLLSFSELNYDQNIKNIEKLNDSLEKYDTEYLKYMSDKNKKKFLENLSSFCEV